MANNNFNLAEAGTDEAFLAFQASLGEEESNALAVESEVKIETVSLSPKTISLPGGFPAGEVNQLLLNLPAIQELNKKASTQSIEISDIKIALKSIAELSAKLSHGQDTINANVNKITEVINKFAGQYGVGQVFPGNGGQPVQPQSQSQSQYMQEQIQPEIQQQQYQPQQQQYQPQQQQYQPQQQQYQPQQQQYQPQPPTGLLSNISSAVQFLPMIKEILGETHSPSPGPSVDPGTLAALEAFKMFGAVLSSQRAEAMAEVGKLLEIATSAKKLVN